MPSSSKGPMFLAVALLLTFGYRSTWAAEAAKENRDAPPVDASAAGAKATYFRLAIAEPLRHNRLDDVAADIARYRSKGYNALFFENDYLRWTFGRDGDAGFGGDWRMFNLFDFTRGGDRQQCRDYLHRLCRMCGNGRLDVYASFWLPQLTAEFHQYLHDKHPDALGRTGARARQPRPSAPARTARVWKFWCALVEELMRDFPEIRGLKIATLDNGAFLCDEHCPHAHGTSQAEHAANLFACVQGAMRRVRPDAQFLVYPWFWKAGFKDVVLPRLKEPYYIISRYSQGARQQARAGNSRRTAVRRLAGAAGDDGAGVRRLPEAGWPGARPGHGSGGHGPGLPVPGRTAESRGGLSPPAGVGLPRRAADHRLRLRRSSSRLVRGNRRLVRRKPRAGRGRLSRPAGHTDLSPPGGTWARGPRLAGLRTRIRKPAHRPRQHGLR